MAEEKLRVTTWIALITLAILLIGQWVSVNARLSVLEAQVKADHDRYENSNEDISVINTKLDNIQQSIIKLSDLKADREFKHD